MKINWLIKEKLHEDVKDVQIRGFIEEILQFEKDYKAKRGKIEKYEKILSKHMRMQ